MRANEEGGGETGNGMKVSICFSAIRTKKLLPIARCEEEDRVIAHERTQEGLVAGVRPDEPEHVEGVSPLCGQLLGFKTARQDSVGHREGNFTTRSWGERPCLKLDSGCLGLRERSDQENAEQSHNHDCHNPLCPEQLAPLPGSAPRRRGNSLR